MGCLPLLEIKDKTQTALTNSILDYIWIWNGVSVSRNFFSFQARSFPLSLLGWKTTPFEVLCKKQNSGETHTVPVKSLVVRALTCL